MIIHDFDFNEVLIHPQDLIILFNILEKMTTITYLHTQQAQDFSLSTFLSQSPYTVLFFYPKDDTSACTLESQWFSTSLESFQKVSCQVLWISSNDHDSHLKFCSKYSLNIPLVSDTELSIHNDPRFLVWIQKSMFGKKYMWIERATFVLDSQGVVRKERRKVSVKNHVKSVLDFVLSLW